MTSLPTRIPELDKRAVRERLDKILAAISLARSVVDAAFELVSEAPTAYNEVRHLRDIDVIEAATVLIKRAEDMVEDLMNNPPALPEEAVATGHFPSSTQPESTV